MARNIHLCRVYCEDEELEVINEWLEDIPTECPNNPAHTIDVSIDDTISESNVKAQIDECAAGELLYHNFSFPELNITSPDTEGYADLILPSDFYFLSIEYWAGTGSNAVLGDKICAAVDPMRNLEVLFPGMETLGRLQADAASGQNAVKFHTSAIAVGILQPGYLVSFAEDTEMYKIATIDKSTGNATLGSNLLTSFSLGDKIVRTVCLGKDMWVYPSGCPLEYGDEKIGASRLPAGMAFRVHYKASDTNGRTIRVNVMGSLLEVS